MAVTYTYTGTDGDIEIDFTNQEINCEDTIDSLENQEIVDACREAEFSTVGMAFPKICNASGKEYLDTDNGVQVGITVVLLENWVVFSEKVSGVFRVLGGNLVQVSGGDPFKENANLTYINILSAASTIVSVSTGSGLSAAEHNALMGIETTVDGIESTVGDIETKVDTVDTVVDGIDTKVDAIPTETMTTEEHEELMRKKFIVGGKLIV